MKIAPGLPSLRRKDVFRCLREAVRTARKRGFSVAHFAILGNHIHFMIEPKGPLSFPLQSLAISFARRLNARLGRNGAVFQDRYHLRVARTPTEVRRVLGYVLTNEHRHRASTGARGPVEISFSPFSSAKRFSDWSDLFSPRVRLRGSGWPDQTIENWFDEFVAPPRTWLLREGWKHA